MSVAGDSVPQMRLQIDILQVRGERRRDGEGRRETGRQTDRDKRQTEAETDDRRTDRQADRQTEVESHWHGLSAADAATN